MINFDLFNPTKVIFGKGTEMQVGAEIKALGCKKVLVHYGGGSAKKSGVLDRVYESLKKEGIEYVSLGGVVPNPRLSLVHEGLELCRKENVDFLLAVGGGSVIDSAKAIGYGLYNKCDPWDFYGKRLIPAGCAPVGSILTIAAAGSETSNSSVITNEDGWLKRGYNHDACRPKFAIMNPELTYTLPAYQTACGCVDIMMHTLERYFTTTKNVELIDRMSEGLLKTVLHNTKILKADPANYDARAEVMWAGSISHNGLLGTGRVGDWATHQFSMELGAMFDVAHGAGLSATWGRWARYVYKTDIARFVQFAVNVMGCEMDFQNQEKTALEGISAMEDFFRLVGLPVTISELGITVTDEQIEDMSEKCTFFGKREVGNFQKLGKADITAIFKMAR
ncbi:MAG: iron-containing alcohol dehydrogenase [Christensenellales bacterium]